MKLFVTEASLGRILYVFTASMPSALQCHADSLFSSLPPDVFFIFFSRGAETQLKNKSKTWSFQRAEIHLGEILELLKEVDIGIRRISPGNSYVYVATFHFVNRTVEALFALCKALIEHRDSCTLPLKRSKTYRLTAIYK